MREFTKAAVATLSATVMFAGQAGAATVSTNLNVRIEILSECKVSAPADLDFGAHGVLDSQLTATSSLNVTCTKDVPYTLSFGAGTGPGATITDRKMKNGAEIVNYALYREAGHTTNWASVSASGTGVAVSYDIYGVVPPQATPPVGVYTDIVAVTVTY